MTALEKLKASKYWHPQYNLPISEAGNNPHIYTAYAELVLRLHGETVVDQYKEFYLLCAVPERDGGLFYRWPGGRGGPNSHDEVMGACMMDRGIAREIIGYLDAHDGNFASHGSDPKNPERYNIYRFLWLRPFLAQCAGYRVGLVAQAIWCAKLIVDSFRHPNSSKIGPGARLRAWLMASQLRELPACALVWQWYRWRLERAGRTLRHDLEQEPRWKELAELAPEKYLHPQDERKPG